MTAVLEVSLRAGNIPVTKQSVLQFNTCDRKCPKSLSPNAVSSSHCIFFYNFSDCTDSDSDLGS